jgi:hypothetical protein
MNFDKQKKPVNITGQAMRETYLFQLIRIVLSLIVKLSLQIQPIKQTNKTKDNNCGIEHIANVFKKYFSRPQDEISQSFKNLLRTHDVLFFFKNRKIIDITAQKTNICI